MVLLLVVAWWARPAHYYAIVSVLHNPAVHMKLNKNFISPPHRRAARPKQGCNSRGISTNRGRQQSSCQPCLERGLASSCTPSRRLVKPFTATSEEEFRSYTENSASSPQRRAQDVTAAERSASQSEAVMDTCAYGNDKPGFDMMAIKKPSLGFPEDVYTQGHGTSGETLPDIPGFEYDLNDDLDFDVLCGSSTPSGLREGMPYDLSDMDLRHDITALAQNTDDFSAKMGDHSAGIFSLVPNYHLEQMSRHGRLQSIEPCSNHNRTCMSSAVKILHALHMPPAVCLSAAAETSGSGTPQPRMTDSVLSTNREAVRVVSSMLECTCSLSSQVQLVLIIICGKLIAWYRAVVRNRSDGFGNSSLMSSVVENDNKKHEDHTERVIHQPITIGEYSFDVTLENKIRAQVVFSELQSVKVLIKSLSGRVKETKFGNFWNTAATNSGSGQHVSSRLAKPDETGLAEASQRSLTVFFHTQLQTAKAEINLILNGGHNSACVSEQSSDLDG